MKRFAHRADRFPPHPVEKTEDLRPLSSVRDLIEAGRRYKNCLGSYIDAALIGDVAYAEFAGECIVEFKPLTGSCGWLLWDVHGNRNKGVPWEVSTAARAACLSQGIPAVEKVHGGHDFQGYRKFIRRTSLPVWMD